MNATAASVARAAAARSTSVRASFALGVAALLSAAGARLALAWSHVTPVYFPDEYRYAALGRSLAHLHGATIRGHSAHFPALLQPLLTAPAWWASNLETSYRIVQAIESVAFTLAAVPVLLVARRLGLSRRLAVAAAALALLVPDGIFAGFVLSEPIAYPLVLGAVAAALAALVRPSRRAQIVFLVLAAAAAAARVQFVVLPLCYLGAALVVALRERRVRAAAREQWLVLAVLVAAALAVVARGPATALGYYGGVLQVQLHPIAALAPLGRNLLVLLYAGGWILVPGALLGLALALARPRSRVELAFGAIVATTGAALLLEASFLGETDFAQERYFFYLLPLLGLCFCLYATRGWPYRRAHAALAAGMLLLAGLVPLSQFAQDRTAGHSPFLIGVEWVELELGNGNASLAIALVAATLAVAAAACSLRPRAGTAAALATAIAFCSASYGTAWAYDRANTRAALHRYLPADRSWVDAAGFAHVTLVTAYGGSVAADETQLFWNRSLASAAVLPGAAPPDDRHSDAIRVGADGTLETQAGALRGPLLLDGHGTTAVLRRATAVAAARSFTLWRPSGRAQLALVLAGRSVGGALAPRGAVTVWPGRASAGLRGWLELTVTTDATSRLRVVSPGRFEHTFRASAGRPLRLRLAVCSRRGPWTASWSGPQFHEVHGRFVAGHASTPRFVADTAACPKA